MELQSSPGAYDDISSRQLVQSSMTERWLRTVVLVPSLKPSITSIIESVLWQLRWLPLEEKQRVTNSDAAKSGRCWLYPEPAENLVRVWSLLLTFKCGTLYTCLLYFPTNRMPLNKGLNSFFHLSFLRWMSERSLIIALLCSLHPLYMSLSLSDVRSFARIYVNWRSLA